MTSEISLIFEQLDLPISCSPTNIVAKSTNVRVFIKKKTALFTNKPTRLQLEKDKKKLELYS
ncbi:hypothetical protein BCV72DRAFT_234699 [Rhizopus microsporus var. microsporus]|uniref:Uncharacterized protein n=2 Tax=Rhizopus microsporus TaxID=58291 RepID=A0A2G4SFZ0_RHIZD|nr:uncharacterized protein RHIMIDRAFT_274273 [Rhizopus microsporus ATCC 52813]ORE02424.1 hypothetical protein BCV72DRAFT_234699 [Rhizopus microsporus var. microsporus]PHZ07669.1 hypothetical protein RHIMIDRAFT_274273 [Rhizopus microsporus ATCC 52813]